MEVLHDWTDQQSQQILQQIRKVGPDVAKLLVVETVLPDESAWAADKGRHFGNHLDINMLVLTGGRERTSDEFARLFVDSGWRLSRVIPTASPYPSTSIECEGYRRQANDPWDRRECRSQCHDNANPRYRGRRGTAVRANTPTPAFVRGNHARQ